jgi:hypothetical protein
MESQLFLNNEDKNTIKTAIALIKDDNYICHYIGKRILTHKINKIVNTFENDFNVEKYVEEFKEYYPNLEYKNYRLSHTNIIKKCEEITKLYDL